MAKRKTKEEQKKIFIQKANEKHNFKFDYSKVEYINDRTCVCIICPEHKEFHQSPTNHLVGNGCPKCSGRYLNAELFIKKGNVKHENKYDYSKVNYSISKNKVIIICHELDENRIEHGEFLQTPNDHLSGCGCPKCGNKRKPLKKIADAASKFISESTKIHNNKYDYSKTEYIDAKTKVCVICPEHDEFWIRPTNHLNKVGCPICVGRNKTTEIFIEEANKKHNYKYDYTKVNYIDSKTKVIIICPDHKEFLQSPSDHISGGGCPKCAGKFMDLEYFIEKSNLKHNFKYDYSKAVYEHGKKSICIICHEKDEYGNEHGEFLQTPTSHSSNGSGCPKCATKNNLFEKRILKLIKENFLNEKIEYQFKSKWLGRLSIDMVLTYHKIAIECQGRQHFKEIEHFGGADGLSGIMERDVRKHKLCLENDFTLLYFADPKRLKNIDTTNYLGKIYVKEQDLIEEIKRLINLNGTIS